MQTMDAVLSARGLQFDYPGGFHLEVQDLQLPAGQAVAMVGPNGSGKTTLLKLLALLLRPDSGEVRLGGTVISGEAVSVSTRRQIGLVFQRPLMLRGSVFENVAVGLRLMRLPQDQIRRRAQRWLEHFGIDHLADKPARELSGGETRRVALARALVLEPAVLLLDEPFADLDWQARQTLIAELARVCEQTQAAVLVATHDRHEAVSLCARLGVMFEGRLVQEGPTRTVLERPVCSQIARLLGMQNIFPGQLQAAGGQDAKVILDGGLELPTSCSNAPTEVVVGIRPEHVKIDDAAGGQPVVAKGVVRALQPDADLLRVTVASDRTEFHTLAIMGRGLSHRLRLGQEVGLVIRPEHVHVMPR